MQQMAKHRSEDGIPHGGAQLRRKQPISGSPEQFKQPQKHQQQPGKQAKSTAHRSQPKAPSASSGSAADVPEELAIWLRDLGLLPSEVLHGPVTAADVKLLRSGVVAAQVMQQCLAREMPDAMVLGSASPADTWAEVLRIASEYTVATEITTQDGVAKELVRGNLRVIVELLVRLQDIFQMIRANEELLRNPPMVAISVSEAEMNRLRAGADADSLGMFLIGSLAGRVGVTLEQAAALFNGANTNYLSQLLMHGPQHNIRPIFDWVHELYESRELLAELAKTVPSIDDSTGLFRILGMFLLAPDESVCVKACTLFAEVAKQVAQEVSEAPPSPSGGQEKRQVYPWSAHELSDTLWNYMRSGFGLASFLSCWMNMPKCRPLLANILSASAAADSGSDLTSWFRVDVHQALPNAVVNMSFVQELLQVIDDNALPLAHELSQRDLPHSLTTYALRFAEPCHCKPVRQMAIGLLAQLWAVFTTDIEREPGLPKSLLITISKGFRETGSQELQLYSLSTCFKLLQRFADTHQPFAPFLYKTLIFALIEFHRDETTRNFIVQHMAAALARMPFAPVSVLVMPLVKQITLQGFSELDLAFLHALAQHQRLSDKDALKLAELAARIAINDQEYSNHAADLLLALIQRFALSHVIMRFVIRLFEVCAKLLESPESSPEETARKGLRVGLLSAILRLGIPQLNDHLLSGVIERHEVLHGLMDQASKYRKAVPKKRPRMHVDTAPNAIDSNGAGLGYYSPSPKSEPSPQIASPMGSMDAQQPSNSPMLSPASIIEPSSPWSSKSTMAPIPVPNVEEWENNASKTPQPGTTFHEYQQAQPAVKPRQTDVQTRAAHRKTLLMLPQALPEFDEDLLKERLEEDTIGLGTGVREPRFGTGLAKARRENMQKSKKSVNTARQVLERALPSFPGLEQAFAALDVADLGYVDKVVFLRAINSDEDSIAKRAILACSFSQAMRDRKVQEKVRRFQSLEPGSIRLVELQSVLVDYFWAKEREQEQERAAASRKGKVLASKTTLHPFNREPTYSSFPQAVAKVVQQDIERCRQKRLAVQEAKQTMIEVERRKARERRQILRQKYDQRIQERRAREGDPFSATPNKIHQQLDLAKPNDSFSSRNSGETSPRVGAHTQYSIDCRGEIRALVRFDDLLRTIFRHAVEPGTGLGVQLGKSFDEMQLQRGLLSVQHWLRLLRSYRLVPQVMTQNEAKAAFYKGKSKDSVDATYEEFVHSLAYCAATITPFSLEPEPTRRIGALLAYLRETAIEDAPKQVHQEHVDPVQKRIIMSWAGMEDVPEYRHMIPEGLVESDTRQEAFGAALEVLDDILASTFNIHLLIPLPTRPKNKRNELLQAVVGPTKEFEPTVPIDTRLYPAARISEHQEELRRQRQAREERVGFGRNFAQAPGVSTTHTKESAHAGDGALPKSPPVKHTAPEVPPLSAVEQAFLTRMEEKAAESKFLQFRQQEKAEVRQQREAKLKKLEDKKRNERLIKRRAELEALKREQAKIRENAETEARKSQREQEEAERAMKERKQKEFEARQARNHILLEKHIAEKHAREQEEAKMKDEEERAQRKAVKNKFKVIQGRQAQEAADEAVALRLKLNRELEAALTKQKRELDIDKRRVEIKAKSNAASKRAEEQRMMKELKQKKRRELQDERRKNAAEKLRKEKATANARKAEIELEAQRKADEVEERLRAKNEEQERRRRQTEVRQKKINKLVNNFQDVANQELADMANKLDVDLREINTSAARAVSPAPDDSIQSDDIKSLEPASAKIQDTTSTSSFVDSNVKEQNDGEIEASISESKDAKEVE